MMSWLWTVGQINEKQAAAHPVLTYMHTWNVLGA